MWFFVPWVCLCILLLLKKKKLDALMFFLGSNHSLWCFKHVDADNYMIDPFFIHLLRKLFQVCLVCFTLKFLLDFILSCILCLLWSVLVQNGFDQKKKCAYIGLGLGSCASFITIRILDRPFRMGLRSKESSLWLKQTLAHY